MTDSELRHIILDLVTEDSYALSEIVAKIRDAHPGHTMAEARSLARRGALSLIADGLVVATWLETPSGPEKVLDPSATEVAMADDLAWLFHNSWRPHVRLVATALGEAAYRRSAPEN